MKPAVSIVIVAYQTPGLLRECLTRIKHASITMPFEVVVVDNDPASSCEQVASLSWSFPVIYLPQYKNKGFSAGNNQGVRASHGEYILVMNADIMMRSGVVECLVQALERDSGCGLVAPKLLNPDMTVQESACRFPKLVTPVFRRTVLGATPWGSAHLRRYFVEDPQHHPEQIEWIFGACFMVRKQTLVDIGGFDERYFLYFEDTDLCARLIRTGLTIRLIGSAEVIHYHARQSMTDEGVGIDFGNPLTWVHATSAMRFFWRRYTGHWPRNTYLV